MVSSSVTISTVPILVTDTGTLFGILLVSSVVSAGGNDTCTTAARNNEGLTFLDSHIADQHNEDNGATHFTVTPRMSIWGMEVSHSHPSVQRFEDLRCDALLPGNKLRVSIV